jgi:C4-dicarboxylate-specific signal transduction histidine kinase
MKAVRYLWRFTILNGSITYQSRVRKRILEDNCAEQAGSQEVTAMATANIQTNMKRSTGIDVVGDIPWGTHFCLFYDTKADLLETLVCYFRPGLESQEFCLWVVAPPVTKEDALEALQAVPGSNRYLLDGDIEIVSARDVYLPDGTFDLNRTLAGWIATLGRASARGYVGVRLAADTAWLESKHWKDFCEYEDSVNGAIANQTFAALCTYPLAACGAGEILDVVRTHQFAVTKRRGGWDIIETAGHKQAKAEIKRLNEELEQRVMERTSQLAAVNEELTKEVADRQHAENALRRTEAYLLDAQRLAHSGSWAWNVTTREVLHWSAECFRLYGFDRKIGLPSWEQWGQRIHPEDRHKRQQTVEEAIRQKTDYELNYRIVLPDCTVRYIRSVAHPVFSASGDLVEFVGTAVDVTEQKRADEGRERLRLLEADLAHMNRVSMMGELTASLAHEIKQPIAAAVSNAEACLLWLARDQPDLGEMREAATEMVKEARRAAEITNRVRSLFKKEEIKREILDFNEIIADTVSLIREEADRHSISVRTELDAELPRVSGDRVQLQQVLINLMLNGREAMKVIGGELVIRSQRDEEGRALISVSDMGVGLPAEKADQIFTPFFTTKSQGTGMGLAISRSIVVSHGGRLWATANSGQGATFYFTLPNELAKAA